MVNACVKLKMRYQAGGAVYSIGDSVILDVEEAQRITALGAGEMIPFPVSQTPLDTLLTAKETENAPLDAENTDSDGFLPAEGAENAPLVPLAADEPKLAPRKTTKK